jgi:hypothetical protein
MKIEISEDTQRVIITEEYLDDLNLGTHSLIGYTALFTALTDGRIPYHVNDSTGLADSGLTWDQVNGRLGIGVASPVTGLDVNSSIRARGLDSLAYTNSNGDATSLQTSALFGNSTPFSGDSAGGVINGAIFNPVASTTNTTTATTVRGFWVQPVITSSAATARLTLVGGQVVVLRGSANDLSHSTNTNLRGVLIQSGHDTDLPDSAVTNTAYGITASIINSSGTINNAYGFVTTASIGNASGPANPVISNYYGINLTVPTFANGGTITNNWGVYSADATAKNYFAGIVGMGTTSPNANSVLDLSSTTKAFLPPRMTTAQKAAIASPTAGMIVYDTTLNKLCVYTTAWETITSV